MRHNARDRLKPARQLNVDQLWPCKHIEYVKWVKIACCQIDLVQLHVKVKQVHVALGIRVDAAKIIKGVLLHECWVMSSHFDMLLKVGKGTLAFLAAQFVRFEFLADLFANALECVK